MMPRWYSNGCRPVGLILDRMNRIYRIEKDHNLPSELDCLTFGFLILFIR